MIQILTPQNIGSHLPDSPASPPVVTIYRSGRIRLSASLASEMNVQEGYSVLIIHHQGHLYLAHSKKDSGWILKAGSSPCFYASDLVRWLTSHLELPFPKISRVKFKVASAPQYINGFHAFEILTNEHPD